MVGPPFPQRWEWLFYRHSGASRDGDFVLGRIDMQKPDQRNPGGEVPRSEDKDISGPGGIPLGRLLVAAGVCLGLLALLVVLDFLNVF
jgi:hypothetical protein